MIPTSIAFKTYIECRVWKSGFIDSCVCSWTFIFHLSDHSFIWNHCTLCPYICLFIDTPVHTFVYSLIHLSIHLFIHWFIYPYICLFIDSSIHTFVYSLIHLSIHLFIHWYICQLFQPLCDPLLYHVIKLYKLMKTNLYFCFKKKKKCMYFIFSYFSLRYVYKPFAK